MGKPGKALRHLGVAATVLIPLLAGCAAGDYYRDDPLYGGQGADADYAEYGPPPYRRPPVAASSSSSSPSTATLAANTKPTLDQNYLGIDRHGKNQAKGNQFSWEQAQDLLRARGVNYQQLENRDGQWHFVCSMPNRQNPSLSRFYEATASDDLSAVKAVIERIDTQR